MANFVVFASHLCQNCRVNPSTKNSSQTQHCRSETRRKEEQKIQRKWSTAKILQGCEIFATCKILQGCEIFPTCEIFATCEISHDCEIFFLHTLFIALSIVHPALLNSCCPFEFLPFCSSFGFLPFLPPL